MNGQLPFFLSEQAVQLYDAAPCGYGLFSLDAGYPLLYANLTLLQLLGLHRETSGQPICLFEEFILPDYRETVYACKQELHAAQHGILAELEYPILTENGRTLWLHESVRIATMQGRHVYQSSFIDVTTRHTIHAQEMHELSNRASRDALTGLYNKHMTKELIQRQLQDQGQGAILLLDIDNFKAINDSMGHIYGDTILSEAAKAMRKLCSPRDIIGRFGGDEFVILLSERTEDEVYSLTEALLNAMQHLESKHSLGISCSIGLALIPQAGKEYQELFSRADIALYTAKAQGKNCFASYSPSMTNVCTLNNDYSQNKIDNVDYREHISGAVFRLFYKQANVPSAIAAALKLMGHILGIERISIYARRSGKPLACLYTWASATAKTLKNPLDTCPDALLQLPRDQHDAHDCHCVSSQRDATMRVWMQARDSESFLLCHVTPQEESDIYILYEKNVSTLPNPRLKEQLITSSRIIGTFLQQHMDKEQQDEQNSTSRLTQLHNTYQAVLLKAHVDCWEYNFANATIAPMPGSRLWHAMQHLGLTAIPLERIEAELHPESLPIMQRVLEDLRNGAPQRICDLWVKHKDTFGYRQERVFYITQFDAKGHPESAIGTSVDITPAGVDGP